MIRKKVRYKCQRGHTWERTIEQRGDVEVGEAVRCAVCGGGFVSFEIVEQTYEQRGAVGAIDPLRGGEGRREKTGCLKAMCAGSSRVGGGGCAARDGGGWWAGRVGASVLLSRRKRIGMSGRARE